MIEFSSILILACGLMAVCLWFRLRNERRRGKGNTIPGPKGLPFVGLGFEANPDRFHFQMIPYAEKYGDILHTSMFGSNMVFLNSARLIRKCFAEEPFKYIMNDRPPLHISKFLQESKGSLGCVSAGKEHSRLRKIFVKGLHVYGDGIKVFEEKINQEIDVMIKQINYKRGKEFECIHIIQQLIISILSVLITGEEITDKDEGYNMFIDYAESFLALMSPAIDRVLMTFPFMRFVPGPWKRAHDRVVKSLELLKEKILLKQKGSYDPTIIRGLVDYLINIQKEEEKKSKEGEGDVFFTDEVITGIIGDIIAGGLITTRATLSSTILCLLHHPEVQQKAQEEIFRVIGTDRKPSLKDKPRCPYIEAIFNEVQRFVPAIPFIGSHFNAVETVLEGYNIPANSLIIPNVFYIFHNENIWGDPWSFRPERFLDENGALLHRDHPLQQNLIPFGVGKRRCVGEEFGKARIFLVVATLLQHFTFVKARDEPSSCDPRSSFYKTEFITTPKPFYCKAISNF